MKKVAYFAILAGFLVACGTSTPKQQEVKEEVVMEQTEAPVDSLTEVVEEDTEVETE